MSPTKTCTSSTHLQDAWFDRDDDDDCFFDSHDDRQGVFVKGFYFYDARSDFLDLDDWMAPRLGYLARLKESIVKQWQQAYHASRTADVRPVLHAMGGDGCITGSSRFRPRFATSAAQQATRYDVDFSCRMANIQRVNAVARRA